MRNRNRLGIGPWRRDGGHSTKGDARIVVNFNSKAEAEATADLCRSAVPKSSWCGAVSRDGCHKIAAAAAPWGACRCVG